MPVNFKYPIKWQLVARPEGKPERDPSELIIHVIRDCIFDSAQEAMEFSKRDLACLGLRERGHKIRPRVALNDQWSVREHYRLYRYDGADKKYEPIPQPLYSHLHRNHRSVLDKMLGNHYLHMSDKGDGKIAYTENPEKGTLDIQTRMGFGAYLVKEFRDDFTDAQIAEAVLILSNATAKRRLYVTKTAEEAVAVYLNGPNSCMSKELHHYSGSRHPASVYAGGDLAVAFILDGKVSYDLEHADVEAIEKYGVTARAVVWPAKKLTGRIYGDEVRLREALISAGYDPDQDELCGARIPALEEDDGSYTMPYLDGAYEVSGPVGGFFTTTNDGDYECQSTSGVISEEGRAYCNYYEEYHRGESYFIVDIDADYSERAVENGHAFQCDYTGDFYSENTPQYDVNTRAYGTCAVHTWAEPAVQEYAFLSEFDDEYYASRHYDQAEVIVANGEVQIWTLTQAEDHGFHCAYNGLYYSSEHHEYVTIGDVMVLADDAEAYREANADTGVTEPATVDVEPSLDALRARINKANELSYQYAQELSLTIAGRGGISALMDDVTA